MRFSALHGLFYATRHAFLQRDVVWPQPRRCAHDSMRTGTRRVVSVFDEAHLREDSSATRV